MAEAPRRAAGSSALIASLLLLLLLQAACTPPPSSGGPPPADSAPDAPSDAAATTDGPEVATGVPCAANAECDDGLYCNGEERCVGARCAAGRAPCDDGCLCTHDACDEAARACAHGPDDARCGDGDACNGVERCDPTAVDALSTGCRPARARGVVDCDDGNTCTLDGCDPAVGCVHSPRDLDGDGAVDRACTLDGTPGGPRGTDCNDGDEAVSPAAQEVCDDGRDNNCDGQVDAADPRCLAANDACASATVLPGPGTYVGSTAGLRDDYPLSCNAPGQLDAAFEFTLATRQDVTVAMAASTGANAAVALIAGECDPRPAELRCSRASTGLAVGPPALRAHDLSPGTYRVLVETGGPPGRAFGLVLGFEPPTAAPLDDACPAGSATAPALELASGATRVAALSVLEDDHLLSCNASTGSRRDAVYRITLAAPSDLRLTLTPPATRFSHTFVSLRGAACGTASAERRCQGQFGAAPFVLTEPGLPAGTYWVVVENTVDLDVQVRADITPL